MNAKTLRHWLQLISKISPANVLPDSRAQCQVFSSSDTIEIGIWFIRSLVFELIIFSHWFCMCNYTSRLCAAVEHRYLSIISSVPPFVPGCLKENLLHFTWLLSFTKPTQSSSLKECQGKPRGTMKWVVQRLICWLHRWQRILLSGSPDIRYRAKTFHNRSFIW